MQTASIIGIDLGTTYSRVGVWRNGQVEIIPDDQGHKAIPSCVAFTDTKCLVGYDAYEQITRNPINTVFNVKRFIGRKSDDLARHNDTKYYPFKLSAGPNGRPIVNVQFKGEMREFHAEQITSMILMKLKETAEAYLKVPVKDVVITVPAHFNNLQRQATLDAGTIAGLNVRRVLNEPSAAAMAHALQINAQTVKREVLVFSLGGGTFDVSLLNFDQDILEVQATAGCSRLGGEDFDNKLLEHCIADFKNKTTYDIHNNSRAMRRLRNQCEAAKRILSTSTETTIGVDDLYEDKGYQCDMTRAKFEELCLPLFKDTIKLIREVLQRAKVPKNKIDDIVLVGGSTRIPKVVQLISEFFDGKKFVHLDNPDETVVYGAAAQAALMSGQPELDELLILETTPMAFRIQGVEGVIQPVAPKNMSVPNKQRVVLNTSVNNQPNDSFLVFQGEGEDNSISSKFKFDRLLFAPENPPQLEVEFENDYNCMFKVTAKVKANYMRNLDITSEEESFSKSDIKKMIEEAETLKQEDKKQA